MTEKKKPDRNWKEYNEHLVQRRETLLNDVVELVKQGKINPKGFYS